MAADKEAVAPLVYRESTCTNLSVSCPYEIIVYSVILYILTILDTNGVDLARLPSTHVCILPLQIIVYSFHKHNDNMETKMRVNPK